jgi:glycosyltransferase involved in cell wall biosynthesis
MKAAFCFHGPNELGEATTWVRRMLPRLKRRGLDVVAVPLHTAAGCCEVVADLQQDGIEVEIVRAGASPAESVHRMAVTLARISPDVIVVDHVIPALAAGGWARAANIRTVMVLRGDDAGDRLLCDTFLRSNSELRVGAVVAVSKELEFAALKATRTIVDVVRCPTGASVPHETARWRPDSFHAVYLGRLDEEQKRLPSLVRALIATSRALPCFSATIYGDGPLRADIERTLSTEAGHQVSYGGRLPLSDVQPRLLEAQALVLLPNRLGLSSAVQEAMACGVPIVARRTASGSEDVFVDGETASIIQTDDELTEAVRRLSQSESLWRRLSAGGRRLAAADFDIEMAANRWSALLARLDPGRTARPMALPTRAHSESAWATYLCQRTDLDAADAIFLIERGRLATAALERYLDDRRNSWDDRRRVLRAAARHRLVDVAQEAVRARELAREAERIDDDSDAHRYHLGVLHERAGDLDAAQDFFAGVAGRTSDPVMRTRSLYQLAAVARRRGRVDDAKAWADACLDVEPQHQAAAALRRQLARTASHG